MKTYSLALMLFAGVTPAFTQETIPFEAHLGLFSGPYDVLFGEFNLSPDGRFSGSGWISDWGGGTVVKNFRATSISDPGTSVSAFIPGPIFDFHDPFPGYRQFTLEQTLTTDQVNDLVAGRWYMDVTGLANGSITQILFGDNVRLPIVMVPEPSTLGLLACGGLAVLLSNFRPRARD